MRHALRSLFRQPLFTCSAVATIALGVGVNSTIFTLANAALFRPLPGIAEPAQLVWVSSAWRDRAEPGGLSYPDFLDYRDAAREVFADLFAFSPTPLSLGTGGAPQRIRGHLVTGSYFDTLGVRPAAGRLLADSDDRAGAAPVAVIAHRLWTERFDASPAVLGSPAVLNGRSFVIVGVAPEGFSGTALGEAASVWVPMALAPVVRSGDPDLLESRGASWLLTIGRLRDGVAPVRAQAAVSTVAARLEAAYPESHAGRMAVVSSAASGLPPQGRAELVPIGTLLLAVTGIVLIIACANVANLLLARGAGRSLEMSIRAALGATRQRLIAHLLTESALLGLAGAAAGLILSFWATDLLAAQLPDADFQGLSPGADLRVLAFTAAIGAASVCIFGVVPALTGSRGALHPRLRETPPAGGRTRLQGAFVVAQLALSLVLLVAGGLSLRAVQKARAVDLGFDPAGVLTASYDLALQNYQAARRIAFRRELRGRIAALPGVTAVGIANVAPLGGTMIGTSVESATADGGHAESRVYVNGAGPGYFEALRIPIVRGRAFSGADGPSSTRVAIVNETLARQLWGNAEPLGREVRFGGEALEVVGVARDSKYDEPTEAPRPFLYTSLDQAAQLDREAVIVRTASAPGALRDALERAVHALDPSLPVFEVRTMEEVLRQRADKERAISGLLGLFGATALLLASLGLYGVMSYAVARRTREIGVRIALGASPSQIARLIASDGLRLALIGASIGTALAAPLAYALGALLFGIQIADLATFLALCAALIAVAGLAAALPARRALHVDPLTALRAE